MYFNNNIILPNFQFFTNQLFFSQLFNQNINPINHQQDNNYIFPQPFQTLIEENNIPNEENDNNENEQKNIFTAYKSHKRGRYCRKENKYEVHGSDSWDNIERKIQVHFLTFLINFCNDALKAEYEHSKYTFKQINYSNKTNVSHNYIKHLKGCNIKDILNLKISDKYKNYQRNANNDLLNKVESSDWLDKLFQMNFIELFNYYYNNEKPLNKIIFENKEIFLSYETKSFYFLLKKYKNLRQKIVGVAKNVYLNDSNEF